MNRIAALGSDRRRISALGTHRERIFPKAPKVQTCVTLTSALPPSKPPDFWCGDLVSLPVRDQSTHGLDTNH